MLCVEGEGFVCLPVLKEGINVFNQVGHVYKTGGGSLCCPQGGAGLCVCNPVSVVCVGPYATLCQWCDVWGSICNPVSVVCGGPYATLCQWCVWVHMQLVFSFFKFLIIIPPSSTPGFLQPAGELDNLPEVAFYMVGPIAEVRKKAEVLAKEQQGS